MRTCQILGVPTQSGASQPGCIMGPAALRTAGLPGILEQLGWAVTDLGDAAPAQQARLSHSNPALRNLEAMVGWTRSLSQRAAEMARSCELPVYPRRRPRASRSASSRGMPAGAPRARAAALPCFGSTRMPTSTPSIPHERQPARHAAGLFAGPAGLRAGARAPLEAAGRPAQRLHHGLRSVDPRERRLVAEAGIVVPDMRAIDEIGIAPLCAPSWSGWARPTGCYMSASTSDFLDPDIAPAVGTTVPGGATFREAHLVMEMLHDSGLVTSLDLVELNPFLDERGRTARLMVDLTASLFGRRDPRPPDRSF